MKYLSVNKVIILLDMSYNVRLGMEFPAAIYTDTRKYWPGKQKFDGLCPITLEPLVLQISYIPHWKALISSSLEL